MRKIDKILTRFGDALCAFFRCILFARGCSSLQWSDLPVVKRNVKDKQSTTLLLKDLVRSVDVPRGSGDHLEIGGRITFCLNTVTNGPMWQYWKLF